jgi:hypothetical protein
VRMSYARRRRRIQNGTLLNIIRMAYDIQRHLIWRFRRGRSPSNTRLKANPRLDPAADKRWRANVSRGSWPNGSSSS